jgi:hypothetical protein
MTAAAFASTSVDSSSAVEVAAWTRGPRPFRIRLRNDPGSGSATVYVGSDSSVSATSGYRLDIGEVLEMTVPVADRGMAAVTEKLYAKGSGASRVYFAADPS